MLALLGASLLLTAIIVRSTYTPAVNLAQTAKILENSLHLKEDYVNNAISTKAGVDRFKTIANNYEDGLKCIQQFTTDRNILVITYKNNQVQYWSDITEIPQNSAYVKEGYSFHKWDNGYYEAIKKSDGNFSVIFLLPVKTNYTVQNQYLENTFAKDLLKDNNIDIADFTDKDAFAVQSISKTNLFWVKVKSNEVNYRFFYFELVLWLITFLVICILVQNICSYFVNKGHLFLSFIFLTAFIVGTRYLNLEYQWPNSTHRLDIFNSQFYSWGKLFPSLGDLCINFLLISWLIAHIYRQRFKLIKYLPGKIGGYIVVAFCVTVLLSVSHLLLKVFYGLVMHSDIDFDVNNVLGLSSYSICGILMLCFSFFIFYLLDEVFQTICSRLLVPVSHQLIILATATIAITCYFSMARHEFISYYILWALIPVMRGYGYRYNNGRASTFMFAGILLICAVISSITLSHFDDRKEKIIRKTLVHKLENPTDSTADYLLKKIERQIITDPFIVSYFRDSVQHNSDYLQNRLQKLYFDGYLSKFDFKVHEYNATEQPLSTDKNYPLSVYKDMVLYSSFKVSNYFYRENESFGFQNYFGILPVIQKDRTLGSVVIELKSKALQTSNYFPELLIDGHVEDKDYFKDYSYAFYSDNKLVAQGGNYIYTLVRTNYQYPVKTFNYRTTETVSDVWYRPKMVYSHLIYKPSERNVIEVSKEDATFFDSITSVTFFFVILLLFSVIVFVASWAWLRIKILTITNNKIKWGLNITLDKIMYKTRIQFSMVFAVVVTLILVGIVTYVSISSQYQSQQDKMIRDRIIKITDAFENGLFDRYTTHLNEQSQLSFDALAASYSSDLVLFDSHGSLLITTQPRIYEDGLIAKRMNARAYINLRIEKRSEYVNDEMIGSMNYKTVYAPVRNTKGETVAFLQLPYFSNQADYKERIGSLLNIMINIYAIIFIAIGLFAVIIARQITNPLSFIQQSLSKTIYGKKNEPIKWDRDDEIGALVKEYNNMIAALEASAARLAQSERESAWREMAKQVAHEIKNPLTPLKLGLQLLEKSWREKDAKFDQKFERFSKSFVEQIESLSQIASEFSAFAKMPDTRMERFNVFDVINQAVTIFKQTDNFIINYRVPEVPFFIVADKDQLLRCFNNLLKNAIEATPPDRLGVLEITYQTDHQQIQIAVKDNGNGIPEGMREKIFEPNFTTKSSGTGLGLAFVKNSVENAGGTVWFETEAGIGTTFILSLPAAV